MEKDRFTRFVEQLGPSLYKRLRSNKNIKNVGAAYENMMRQLAYESSYGESRVARELHNYGGYGWNGSTYTTFKDDDAFLDAYVKLMTSRYIDAVNSPDIDTYAYHLKRKGYMEDSLEHYRGLLRGMKSLSRAVKTHRAANPNLYGEQDLMDLKNTEGLLECKLKDQRLVWLQCPTLIWLAKTYHIIPIQIVQMSINQVKLTIVCSDNICSRL